MKPQARRALVLCFLLFPWLLPAQTTIETEKDEKLNLLLKVFPYNGEIYFNREFLARQEARVSPFLPGTYLVEFRLDGYQTESIWLRLEEEYSYTVEAVLRPLNVALDLSQLPDDVEVYFNGRRLAGPREDVPPGKARLSLHRFGYEPVNLEVVIPPAEEPQDSFLLPAPEFKPLAARLLSVKLSRRVLVPGGAAGQDNLGVRMSVSGPCRAVLTITDSQGLSVKSEELPAFLGEDNFFEFSSLGESLLPGVYHLNLVLSDLQGSPIARESRAFSVEPHRDDRPRALETGSAGLVLTPQARIMPFLDFQLSTGLGIGFPANPSGKSRDLSMFIRTAVRMSPWRDFELTGGFSLGIRENQVPLHFSLGLKYGLPSPAPDILALAAELKGFYEKDDEADMFYGHTGGQLGFPVELFWKTKGQSVFRILISPELLAAAESGRYPESLSSNRGFFLQARAGAGLLWEYKRLSAGVSAAFRTESFLENSRWKSFRPAAPVDAAGEFSLFFPDISLNWRTHILVRLAPEVVPAFFGGFSLDFLF